MENSIAVPNAIGKDYTNYCADGVSWKEEYVAVSSRVSLRVITFSPPQPTNQPTVLFVAGWISLMKGWKAVLHEITKDFKVIYVETREKISSQVSGTKDFSVEAIATDIVKLVDVFELKKNKYIIFGSSLGGTAILESYQQINPKPLCFTLLGPNAEYRAPWWWILIIHLFWTKLYIVLKPFVKWYLRKFRLDIEADRAQYEKYCNALDAADPKKLKPGALALAKYKVWDILGDIDLPVLIIGASKDLLHEPQNLIQMDKMLPRSTFLDMETNTLAHGPELVIEIRKYLESLS